MGNAFPDRLGPFELSVLFLTDDVAAELGRINRILLFSDPEGNGPVATGEVQHTEEDMTKAELIERVSEQYTTLTKRQTEILVNTIFDSIKEALAKGDKIEIRGFGSFRLRQRRMREGRNPKTGTLVNVPSKRVPFFKAGKELKELVDS